MSLQINFLQKLSFFCRGNCFHFKYQSVGLLQIPRKYFPYKRHHQLTNILWCKIVRILQNKRIWHQQKIIGCMLITFICYMVCYVAFYETVLLQFLRKATFDRLFAKYEQTQKKVSESMQLLAPLYAQIWLCKDSYHIHIYYKYG